MGFYGFLRYLRSFVGFYGFCGLLRFLWAFTVFCGLSQFLRAFTAFCGLKRALTGIGIYRVDCGLLWLFAGFCGLPSPGLHGALCDTNIITVLLNHLKKHVGWKRNPCPELESKNDVIKEAIHELYPLQTLLPLLSAAAFRNLPAAHGITGCDTVANIGSWNQKINAESEGNK